MDDRAYITYQKQTNMNKDQNLSQTTQHAIAVVILLYICFIKLLY